MAKITISDREALEAVRKFDRAAAEHEAREIVSWTDKDYEDSFSEVTTPKDFLPDWEPDPAAELRVALAYERGFQLQALRARVRTRARRVIPHCRTRVRARRDRRSPAAVRATADSGGDPDPDPEPPRSRKRSRGGAL